MTFRASHRKKTKSAIGFKFKLIVLIFGSLVALGGCGKPPMHRIIFDTDANNELDDQHALAYLLFNGDLFHVEGVTVNATFNGGNIDEHVEEARRVMELCESYGRIPLLKGSNGSFGEIRNEVHKPDFDGADAVNFIIKHANAPSRKELILLPVGKLTNIALALEKDPSIASRIRIVWLGSNYPQPGEYNQNNDTAAMNFLLNTDVPFEMVTVRYGLPSGTDAVRVTPEEVYRMMPGVGPRTKQPVTGRHGGSFYTFGDYSVSLFEHAEYYGDPPSRALFDMAAVAVVKNPSWAMATDIPAPVLINNQWVERPGNPRTITIYENFNRNEILKDFYDSMNNYRLVNTTAN